MVAEERHADAGAGDGERRLGFCGRRASCRCAQLRLYLSSCGEAEGARRVVEEDGYG